MPLFLWERWICEHGFCDMPDRLLIDKLNLAGPCLMMHLKGQGLREIAGTLTELAPEGKSVSYSAVRRWIKANRAAIEKAREKKHEEVVAEFVTRELPGALDIIRDQLAELIEIRRQMLEFLTRQVQANVALRFSITMELFLRVDAAVHEKAMAIIRLGRGGDDGAGGGDHPVDLERFRRQMEDAGLNIEGSPQSECPQRPGAGGRSHG